jgi:Domain of unknown function (DUF4288)
MGYVPPDAKWWLADLILEFRFEGEGGNLVHYNLTLVRADSAEEAYSKALRFGTQHEDTYTNTDGRVVTVRFRGLRDLLVIHHDIKDGSELLYEEEADVTEERMVAAIKTKDKLSVFEPWVPPEV